MLFNSGTTNTITYATSKYNMETYFNVHKKDEKYKGKILAMF